jgi:hypothetical protein
MGLSFAAAQNAPAPPSLVQIESAKDGIEVEVVDTTGAVIPNTDVILIGPSGEFKGVTSSSGRVHFPKQPQGRYAVHVNARGFKITKAVVDVPALTNVELKVRLAVSVAVMGEIITVESLPLEHTTINVPSSIEEPQSTPPSAMPRPTSTPAPRRNPLTRFFSSIGHKLGS